MLLRRFALASCCVWAASCGGGGSPGADASAVSDDAATPAPFVPEPPAPPVLTPCPSGWRETVAGTDAHVCEPWPETGRSTSCADDEAHFPGELGCARVGTACPATGDFPEGLPTDRAIVYVLASAAPGGDGTLARPYQTLASGTARAAPSHGVVALGRGRYAARQTVPTGVTLWGACVAETVLSGDVMAGSIRAGSGASVEVRNLAIEHSGNVAIGVADVGSTLTIRDVVVRGATESAVAAVAGGRLVLDDVVLRDTAAGASGLGGGLSAGSGGVVEATRVVIERMSSIAIYVRDSGTSIEVSDVSVQDTVAPSSAPLGPFGVVATLGAHVALSSAVIERASGIAAFVGQPGSSLVLRDAVLRDTRPDSSGSRGRAIHVTPGGALRAERVWIEGCTDVAVVADGAGTRVDGSDIVVHDVRVDVAARNNGYGLVSERGAVVAVRRTSLESMVSGGVLALLEGASLAAEDLTVRDVFGQANDVDFGRGIDIEQTATATLRRVRIERTHDVGLSALGDGARVDATEVDVRVTGERLCVAAGTCTRGYGDGVAAFRGGALRLDRFAVAGSATCGAMVAIDGQLDLSVGRLSENAIAVCVQVDGYDLARLSRSVTLDHNERNLEATMLPVPDAVPAR